MKIVFMGTPQFAVPSLQALLAAGHDVVAVVTQPDRPVGRKRVLTPPPVKQVAVESAIPVFQPERLRTSDTVDAIATLQPDLIVTAAYGQILPKTLLDVPRLGCINVHGSLLPHYRGGAPIQRSIMNGEAVTGVTIMYMAEGLDTGDMISRVEVPIEPADNAGTMFMKLSVAGAQLLMETLPSIEQGTAVATPQNEQEATYAPNLTRADEQIDWLKSAQAIVNQVRGLAPMAGAFTLLHGEAFKIWGCGAVAEQASQAEAGAVVEVTTEAFYVQTGSGVLKVEHVQPAGKKAMPARDWLKGARLQVGTVFGGTS